MGDSSVGSWDKITKTDSNVKQKFALSDEVDADGNSLTADQQEFFAESKVRDESGSLLVMYHGTPNAGYTIFNPGTYFTQNKEYADVYQAQGASSLGYKKTATNPDTYKVYLNIKKPFDTRNQTEREIFENDYLGKWGMGTPLMDSGLPDWMDGGDLQEFLEEEGYDYDGLILDEGGVGGYGDEVKSRGLSYVVFSPEQVKNVDNKTPTINPDYRFAISDEMDSEHLDAVERGDMEAAQRMVDDAARMAGWIPENAYHGTGQFGFTSFDPEMSDDKMSIFLSSSSDVSSTYSGGGTVRQISQKSEIAPEELDKASPKKVLELLRKYINPNIEMLDEKERETVIKENQKHIENAIEMAVALPELLGDRWNAGTQAYLNDVIKFLKEMATATTYDEFMSANMEYEAALWEMRI